MCSHEERVSDRGLQTGPIKDSNESSAPQTTQDEANECHLQVKTTSKLLDNFIEDTRNDQKRILILVNPHSGRGKSLKIYHKTIVPFLTLNNVKHELFTSRQDSRVADFLNNMHISELKAFKSILIVSGDGLIYEAINALLKRPDWRQAIDIPIGIIPTGSGNGLAYTLINSLHQDIQSREQAVQLCCHQAVQFKHCYSDLARIKIKGQTDVIWSFLSIGWGLLADIDVDSEWLRRIGELRFTVYGLLRSLTSVSYRGKLSYKVFKGNAKNTPTDINCEQKDMNDDEQQTKSDTNIQDSSGTGEWVHIEDKFACLYAVHQTHVSKATNFSPESTMTDQLTYLTYVRGKLSICQVIQFLLAIDDGSHNRLSYVEVVPTNEFKFQPLEDSKIVVDGEVIPWKPSDGPLEVKMIPRMLKLSWDQSIYQ